MTIYSAKTTELTAVKLIIQLPEHWKPTAPILIGKYSQYPLHILKDNLIIYYTSKA